MEKLIFENKCARVFYDDALQLGKIKWDGNPTQEEYRMPFEQLIQYASKEPVPNFLSDTTNQGVVNPENRKWFEKVMIPKAIEAGLRKAAVVSSANAFKRYYLNMILMSTNKFGLPVKIFSTEDEAVDWFRNA